MSDQQRPINTECLECPLYPKSAPCGRIFKQWSFSRMTLRRPEAATLLSDMLRQHPEAHCSAINADIVEIESRPRRYPQKPQQLMAKTTHHGLPDKPAEPITKEPEKKINPIMIGRMPRKTRAEP